MPCRLAPNPFNLNDETYLHRLTWYRRRQGGEGVNGDGRWREPEGRAASRHTQNRVVHAMEDLAPATVYCVLTWNRHSADQIFRDHDIASHSYQRRRRVVEITSPRKRRRVEEGHRVMVVKPRHERSESCHSEKCLARMQGQTLQALAGGGQWRARTPPFTAGFTAPGGRSVGCVGVQTRGRVVGRRMYILYIDRLACVWWLMLTRSWQSPRGSPLHTLIDPYSVHVRSRYFVLNCNTCLSLFLGYPSPSKEGSQRSTESDQQC